MNDTTTRDSFAINEIGVNEKEKNTNDIINDIDSVVTNVANSERTDDADENETPNAYRYTYSTDETIFGKYALAFVEFSKDLRFMYYALPISTIITVIIVWLRLLFNDSDNLIMWEESINGISSYLIAVKYSVTAIIFLLIQHLYNYKLFQNMSDTKTIMQTNIALSIVIPALLGGGIGAGIYRSIGCLVGIVISSVVGFSLKSLLDGPSEDINKIDGKKGTHLYLWQVQFLFQSVFIMTGIITCSLSTSSTHFGMYALLFMPTRHIGTIPYCCYYLSLSEPEIFNPFIGVLTGITYQIGQAALVYEFDPTCQKIYLICKIFSHIVSGLYIVPFFKRNILYVLANRGSLNSDDLPQLTIIIGMAVYTTVFNVLHKDIYDSPSSQEITSILLQRLYLMFFSILYLSMAPSITVNNEINNIIVEMSKSMIEESTKYQLLSKVVPKNVLTMTLYKRTIPSLHTDVCIFYSDIGIIPIANDAKRTIKLINDINCIMNICMNICNVNRVGSNGNTFVAEAGVANGDNSLFHNINLILNFALLVKGSLKKIIRNNNDNNFGIRMGIHCGIVVGGLIHTDSIPMYSLFGELMYAVKLVESSCSVGKTHISESIKNHAKSSIDFNENGTIRSDGTRTIKTYEFTGFKKPIKLDAFIDQVGREFKKLMNANDVKHRK